MSHLSIQTSIIEIYNPIFLCAWCVFVSFAIELNRCKESVWPWLWRKTRHGLCSGIMDREEFIMWIILIWSNSTQDLIWFCCCSWKGFFHQWCSGWHSKFTVSPVILSFTQLYVYIYGYGPFRPGSLTETNEPFGINVYFTGIRWHMLIPAGIFCILLVTHNENAAQQQNHNLI